MQVIAAHLKHKQNSKRTFNTTCGDRDILVLNLPNKNKDEYFRGSGQFYPQNTKVINTDFQQVLCWVSLSHIEQCVSVY